MTDCCLPGHTTENSSEDNLVGCGCLKTQPFTLIAGTYARGDILFTTATQSVLTNKATTPAALDSESFAIMPFDVVLAADDEMAVYVGGEFNEAAVTGAATLATVKQTLSERGILLRSFG